MRAPDPSSIRRDVIGPYLKFYNLDGAGKPEERAARLQAFWDASPQKLVMATCTECNGDSDARLKECPFCGEQGLTEPEPVQGSSQVLAEVEDEGDAEISVEPPSDAVESDLDDAIAAVRRLDVHLGTTTYELGMALRRIRDLALWKLRLDKYNLSKYNSFYNFVEFEIGMRRAACRRWVRITEEYTQEQVQRYGVTRLGAALRLPDVEREPFLEEVLNDGTGARGPEVAAKARKRQLEAEQAAPPAKAKPKSKTVAKPSHKPSEPPVEPEEPTWPLMPQDGKVYDQGVPLGSVTVPLWKRPGKGRDRVDEITEVALSTEDGPWTRVQLRPDLHLRIVTRQNDEGELVAIVELRKVRVVGSKA